MTSAANEGQLAHWNGRAGQTWSDLQPLIDGMFSGFIPLLVQPLNEEMQSILDVGCGAGALTLAAAERAGTQANCVGIDISAPLVSLAKTRASSAGRPDLTFRVADAQVAAFEPESFDAILSRFGVMFFDDPVAAFGNLHRATRPGGRLRFAAWRAPSENAFMGVAKRAIGHLVDFPAYEPDAPGQFGFAHRDRVAVLLAAAGWQNVRLDPVDVPCGFPAETLPAYATRMGPLGALWEDIDARKRAEIEALLRDAYRPYEHEGEIRFTASCWLADATA